MRVLALAHDLVDDDDARFAELRPAEARMVWELCQADVLREVYFRADYPSGVLSSRSRTSRRPAPRSTACRSWLPG